MAFVEGNQFTTVAGAATTIIAAPATGVRRVIKTITMYNVHSAAQQVTMQFSTGSTTRVMTVTINPATSFVWNDVLVLDAVGELVQLVNVTAAANIEVSAHYGDAT